MRMILLQENVNEARYPFVTCQHLPAHRQLFLSNLISSKIIGKNSIYFTRLRYHRRRMVTARKTKVHCCLCLFWLALLWLLMQQLRVCRRRRIDHHFHLAQNYPVGWNYRLIVPRDLVWLHNNWKFICSYLFLTNCGITNYIDIRELVDKRKYRWLRDPSRFINGNENLFIHQSAAFIQFNFMTQIHRSNIQNF